MAIHSVTLELTQVFNTQNPVDNSVGQINASRVRAIQVTGGRKRDELTPTEATSRAKHQDCIQVKK